MRDQVPHAAEQTCRRLLPLRLTDSLTSNYISDAIATSPAYPAGDLNRHSARIIRASSIRHLAMVSDSSTKPPPPASQLL